LLEPGETLVWTARGRGPHICFHTLFALAFLLLFVPAWLGGLTLAVLKATSGSWMAAYAFVQGLIVCGLLSYIAVRAFLAPSLDRYGLSNRGIIIVERYWPFAVRRYGPSDLDFIKLFDVPGRGEIRFRKGQPRSAMRLCALVGIERPREVAELIRSTLRPDLSLEDGRAAYPVPPLEPRAP
jgi:hypothetical protein